MRGTPFDWVACVRDEVRRVALVNRHAARAGFILGPTKHLCCAFHDDKRPSCTIRAGWIRCWVCNRSWDVIDLEMHSRGVRFLAALRSLAAEYGIPIPGDAVDPAGARAAYHKRRDDAIKATFWRVGLLDLTDRLMVEEKARIFDPTVDYPVNGQLIFELTCWERELRSGGSKMSLLRAYRAFAGVMPDLAEQVTNYGEHLRREAQRATADFIEQMMLGNAL